MSALLARILMLGGWNKWFLAWSPRNAQEGMDEYNRSKWIACGKAATGVELEIVCALKIAKNEAETEFIKAGRNRHHLLKVLLSTAQAI